MTSTGDGPEHGDEHHHSHHDSPRSRRARSPLEVRAMALEAALVDNGVVSSDAIDLFTEALEHRFGPHHGARVVAKAWCDGAFKARLLSDADAALEELGIGGVEGNVRVVENTTDTHNMVVCTLCSCYPWPLLGLPPLWYKSFAYRSRAVAEPRAVLRDFGVDLPAHVKVRVWDSSAEVRYFVLPLRPAGTDHLDEDGLAALVDRNAMIGTGLVRSDGVSS